MDGRGRCGSWKEEHFIRGRAPPEHAARRFGVTVIGPAMFFGCRMLAEIGGESLPNLSISPTACPLPASASSLILHSIPGAMGGDLRQCTTTLTRYEWAGQTLDAYRSIRPWEERARREPRSCLVFWSSLIGFGILFPRRARP